MQDNIQKNKPWGLRQERLHRGLSLEAVGYLADIDPATASRIERGLVEPERATIVKLAKALGMSVSRLRELVATSSLS